MEKVSLIVPIYNAQKYLNLTLSSLMRQTYKNIEYILIDDNKKDNYLKIIKKYEKKYKNVKIIALSENKGVSYARNEGLKVAQGDYLFFCDCDDFIDDDTISKTIIAAKENQADLVEIKKIYWFKHGKRVLYFDAPQLQEKFYINAMRINNKEVCTSTYSTGKLYHRNLIGKTLFDESIRCYEDLVFSNEISKKVKKHVFLDNVNYHYLQRRDSLINSISPEHLNYLSVIRRIKGNHVTFDKRDELIINSTLALITSKISKIDMSLKERKELIDQSILTISEMYPLSKKQMRLYQRFLIGLFKNKDFLLIYLLIIKKIDLLKITFFVKAKLMRKRIRNKRLYQQIKYFYKLNDRK